MLGLAFSLVMARLLDPEGYGYIQYGIALGGVFAIATQPFGQHVVAKIIGKYRSGDAQVYQRYLDHAWLVQTMLFIASLVISSVVLLASERFDVGILVVFIGISVFYTYYGVARGFLDNGRLLVAYLGSNLLQIIAILVVYLGLGSDSTRPALLIYGGSYFLPLAVLIILWPFQMRFRLPRPQWPMIVAVSKMSVPIIISHVGFLVYMSLDLLLLERFVDDRALGVYALAKTLANVFMIISMGVNTVIMPQVASAPRGKARRRLLRNALIWHLTMSVSVLVIYALSYSWLVERVFGPEYLIEASVYLVLAVGMVISQTHSVISQALVGADRASLYAISQVFSVAVTLTAGLTLIPTFTSEGASLTMLAGASAALSIYGLIFLMRLLRGRDENSAPPPSSVGV